MTLLGKILVFINVAASFLMLAWAAALYTNRIDWSNNPAKGDQPAGLLKALRGPGKGCQRVRQPGQYTLARSPARQ